MDKQILISKRNKNNINMYESQKRIVLEQPDTETHILDDSIYLKAKNRQKLIYNDRNQKVVLGRCLEINWTEAWGNILGDRRVLHLALVLDSWVYTFAKTY